MKILLLENIDNYAITYFTNLGYSIDIHNTSLSKDKLLEIITDYNIIGIRSKTQIDKDIIDKSKSLLVIGCFCIGTNQVDLEYCSKKGISVINSPFMNTRSVAELVISHIINLSRQVNMRNIEMHNKVWNKTSLNSIEIRNKTIGIIGYGHVGSQVSILAEALGMKVIYYDIKNIMNLGNSVKCETLDELLKKSDFVTCHVPLYETTENLISENQLKKMKKGSYLLNLSRGKVVDIVSLKKYLDNKHLYGAALDVYPEEPSKNGEYTNILQNTYNVILTPHIGGSTKEAQTHIAEDVCSKINMFLYEGITSSSVNLPSIEQNKVQKINCFTIFNIHKNISGVMSKINNIIMNYGSNIVSSNLSTFKDIGVSRISLNGNNTNKQIIEEIKNEIELLEYNIKTRIL